MTDLTNKVAIVTGSANGLGKALAIELSRQGCNLALIDIDGDMLEKLKAELQNNSQQLTTHRADVSKEEEIIGVRKAILQAHQRVDILINNAGVSISQPFEQLELNDYRWLFEINFWGTIYCTKYFLPDLKQQPGSRLVNIISGFALMGFPGKTAYSSSKSAIMSFTNALKTELTGSSITVSLVVPPPLDTGLVKNSIHIDEEKRKNEADFLQKKGMSLDKAARKIISHMKEGRYRIVVGPMMFWIDTGSRLFPTLVHKFIGRNRSRFDFV